ncbi:molybdenum cofactor biosynthesis protein MoaE [Pseudohoeflea coraliihabitans]|uniref:Molybdenum cofactor biosynthesis protein MoaE n=1 Tax=Pseudohoeflea coraliihabitans TaxID=2860393 RepID=A0ABS6WS14_9HYPH|nr:molybdenum cofactor biosynthesis protein MoaE [Pseudohoeflea sp. DP4N28-3]
MASGASAIAVRIQADDFDAGAELALLSAGRGDVGGVASFLGLCRDEAGRLAALELEHYPGMAERAITQIAEKAVRRFSLLGLRVVHRYGRIAPGGNIVLVAAAAAHRRAAFDGAAYVMDFLKSEAPFWKKEHLADGSSGDWVAAKDSDDAAKDRWAD